MSTNKINIEAVNARAREEQTPDRQWTQKECEEMDEREFESELHDDLPND